MFWVDAGVSRFGMAQVLGKSPCLRVYVIFDLEKVADKDLKLEPFLLDAESIYDFERVAVGWESAPDRIKKKFGQPIRKAAESKE